jgi:hypothetical protein
MSIQERGIAGRSRKLHMRSSIIYTLHQILLRNEVEELRWGTRSAQENLRVRDHLETLGIDWRIILKAWFQRLGWTYLAQEKRVSGWPV